MEYVLLGVLALGLVASIYVAFMSSKTWPVYQTVLVVFVFIAALVFYYLGARTLATHRNWRELYNRNQEQARNLESRLLPLVGGSDDRGGAVAGDIPRLKHELSLAIDARGGGVYYAVRATAWQDDVLQVTLSAPGTLPPQPKLPTPSRRGAAADPDADEGEFAAEEPVEQDEPVEDMDDFGADAPAEPADAAGAAEGAEAKTFVHGLVPDSVLFVFDQRPLKEGGRYLGEFKVVEAAADNPSVRLTPNLPLSASQAKSIATAVPGMLVMYTLMPPDDATVFARLDPAVRNAILPADTAEEFAREDRELRDYHTFFHENFVQRGLIGDSISQTASNIERIEAAAAETKKEAAFRETEKTNLGADLGRFQAEVTAIANYEQSLRSLLGEVRDQLKATYVENRQAAATLVREQLKAADEINRRSNVAAN